MRHKGLLLSGGSLSVLALLGHLSYLCDNGKADLAAIEYWGGISSGAIMAFILLCGVKPADALALFLRTSSLFDFSSKACMLSMVSGRGLYKAQHLRETLKAVCGNEVTKTLGELAAEGKNFFTCAYNLSQKQFAILAPSTAPQMPALDALLCTCALPFLFEPIVYAQDQYVDGGLVNNLPVRLMIETFEGLSAEHLLAILVDKDPGPPPPNMWDWKQLPSVLTLPANHYTLAELAGLEELIDFHMVRSGLAFHDLKASETKLWAEFDGGYKPCANCARQRQASTDECCKKWLR
jgi:predicted acylesterase/phospholipase RssA